MLVDCQRLLFSLLKKKLLRGYSNTLKDFKWSFGNLSLPKMKFYEEYFSNKSNNTHLLINLKRLYDLVLCLRYVYEFFNIFVINIHDFCMKS